MTLKKRVTLIIFGIIVFGLAGPAIIFMAQGYSYDFKGNRLVPSGTLVVTTQPRGAAVQLGDNNLGATPQTQRFLHAGEYSLLIEKNGYRQWKKRVNITPGQVTFAPDSNGEIYLFLGEVQEIFDSFNVSDFFALDDEIHYLDTASQHIYRTGFAETNSTLAASTTLPLNDALIANARTQNDVSEYILATPEGYWYVSPNAEKRLAMTWPLQFGRDPGSIVGIDITGDLVETSDLGTKSIASKVLAFTKRSDDIYYLSSAPASKFFLYHIDESGNSNPLMPVPAFSNAEIIVSPQNNLYLLLDDDLYEINETLEKISNAVNFAAWDEGGETLLYGNNHELWAYKPQSSPSEKLISRSTQPILGGVLNETTRHAFWIEGNEIKAIEVNDAGQPNVYSLLIAANPKKITLNAAGNILGLLDGQTLKLFRLR